jgi:hypothetical protein
MSQKVSKTSELQRQELERLQVRTLACVKCHTRATQFVCFMHPLSISSNKENKGD